MSLVFLKNDDQSRDGDPASTDDHLLPYRWTNYFTNPIRIPRNAQIGYIKSSFQQPLTGWLDDSIFYIVQGRTELNPTIPLFLEGGDLITDWKGVFAEMGRLCNQYGLDGNYNNQFKINDTYEGVLQTIYGEPGTPPLFTDGIQGWNFLLTSDNKVNLRVAQRGMNDVQNQGFNSGGWNGSAGLNILGLTDVDYGEVHISSPYYQATGGANGAGWSVGMSRLNPIVGSVGNAAPSFTTFYNIGWTTGSIVDSDYGIGSGAPMIIPPFNQQITGTLKGHYPVIYTRTPIKQFVGTFTPVAGGGGHTTLTNGYVVKTQRIWPQAFGNNDYPQPNGVVAARGLYNGGYESFGIQSIELIENMPNNTGLTDSREKYLEQCDLNSASTAGIAAGAAVPRYFFGCDIEIRKGSNPGEQYPLMICRILDPDAPYGVTQYIDLAELDITAAALASTAALNSENPVNPGMVATQLSVRFRWTTPYCMCCEYCFRYNPENDTPETPGVVGGNPMTGWVILYDMNVQVDSEIKYFLPGYLGDLTLVEYPIGNLARNYRKGWFDYRKGYRLYKNQLLNLDSKMLPLSSTSFYEGLPMYDMRPLRINNTGAGPATSVKLQNITPEVFDTAGRSEKELTLVANPITNAGDLGEVLTVNNTEYFFINDPDTYIGGTIGLEGAPLVLNNDILALGDQYNIYGLNGQHVLHLTERVNTLHIQIENLAIQSQNGVKSTQNKTIAVVATQDAFMNLDPLNSNNIYNDTAPVINWIDLNNYNEMSLQQIMVKITYDDNTEAVSLINRSDVTIMFRQKPDPPNPTYLPDNIRNLQGNQYGGYDPKLAVLETG